MLNDFNKIKSIYHGNMIYIKLIDKDKSVPESGYLERTLVMAMSPIEISEDDCCDTKGLQIKVIDKTHLKMLIGKYYSESNDDSNTKWKIFLGDETNLINTYVYIRSPMTCKTKDFKICKKCFGEKKVRTPYVGVVAGQCITERLTQLLLRSFHTSGSANLDIDNNVSNFIKENLIDIDETEKIKLIFSNQNIPKEFMSIEGFEEIKNNTVIFNNIDHIIENSDALSTVENIREILRKNDNVVMTPNQYYTSLTECILSVGGGIYSSYIEMILAHIFMVDKENFWRYNQDKKISTKLSDKTIATKISPLLGFLYQPNRISIDGIEEKHLIEKINDEETNLSMHEKIFLQKF